MSKYKGDKSFENGTSLDNSKFGCTTLLLHPMPLTWDYTRLKQFVKDQCESEEIKKSPIFIFKERKDSDHVWIQFDSESLCRLAYAKLQGMELNGKIVNVQFDKRKQQKVQKLNFDKKQNSNMVNMNKQTKPNNFNDHGNYAPTPPVPDMEPPSQETYGLSVGFLTSLGIQPPLRNKVFVANLVLTVSERDLQEVMSLAGSVAAVTLLRNNGAPRGQAAVEYDHAVEAVQAISMLNGQEFYGRPLVVRMYKQEPKLPLPTGLAAVGMGLGPGGEAMKSVRMAVEILPLKHRLETAIKRLSGENIGPDDNYVPPYGPAVVDNFNFNMPFGPGMPPFCMGDGPMPFMPFPPDQMNGPFMPGPMGMPGMPGPNMGMPGPNMPMPGPNMPMLGPNMPMPGPNMPMPGPNMPMPGPNMPMPGPNMSMPGPNMPMPGPNMPMPGPNMSMPGSNMPIPGPNMPIPGLNMPIPEPNMGVPGPKQTTVQPNKTAKTPNVSLENIPLPKSDTLPVDIPGVLEVTLPKIEVKLKSPVPPPLPPTSKPKKLTLSIKSEKMLMGKHEKRLAEEIASTAEKHTLKASRISPPREKSKKPSVTQATNTVSKRRRRSPSSSPEKEPAKSANQAYKDNELTEPAKSSNQAYKDNELTNDLLKLFDSKKKPNLDALQGFMDQVICLSKTMSALRDIVPREAVKEASPRQDRRSPDRPARSADSSETRKEEKRTYAEAKLSKTISALREVEPALPTEEPPSRAWDNDWSPEPHSSPVYIEKKKPSQWAHFDIEASPIEEPKEEYPQMRDTEWSAKITSKSPEHSDSRRKDYKRTYSEETEPASSRPKVRKPDVMPLITSSDMLTFSNLPPTVSLDALSGKMRQVGELRFAELTGAGRAVVRFRRVRDADRCVQLFHRSKVDGHIIEVTPF